jgi:formimidoylglutamate deiminase
MVGGKWVVRNGRHGGEEESARAFTRVLRELLD